MALPLLTVRRVVETLLAHGRVSRGYIGVGTQPVRLPGPLAQQAGQETGLLLTAVSAESPAERAGLFLGDVIVRLGGQPIRSMEDLLVFLNGTTPGVSVPVQVVRAGQMRELAVVMGERS